MRSRQRLTRADWVDAGLVALTTKGPDAVAVERVAAALGATKGSGYWHFANRQELLCAVLERWKQTYTHDLIRRVEDSGGSVHDRLTRLISIVSASAETSPAELLVIGSHDPVVRSAVEDSVAARLAYLEGLLREAGLSRPQARTRAVLAYSAYLGHATLAATTPTALPQSVAERRRMQRALVSLALPEHTDPPAGAR